jgi:hypothetical protein
MFSHRGFATVQFPLPPLNTTDQASRSHETSTFILACHLPDLYPFIQETERQKVLHKTEVTKLRI